MAQAGGDSTSTITSNNHEKADPHSLFIGCITPDDHHNSGNYFRFICQQDICDKEFANLSQPKQHDRVFYRGVLVLYRCVHEHHLNSSSSSSSSSFFLKFFKIKSKPK